MIWRIRWWRAKRRWRREHAAMMRDFERTDKDAPPLTYEMIRDAWVALEERDRDQ